MTVRGQEQQLDEARRVIASLRAELEDVKVDRDSADQALDRERARPPETFWELQAQTLQGTVPGPATSGAYVIKDDSERYICSVDSAGVLWSVARQRDALHFGTRVAAVRVVQAFSNSMTRIRVVRLRTAPGVALDTAPAPPDKSTNEP